jgi:formate/nitrite transporter FocA (FNT family)
VWLAMAGRSVTDKVVAIVLPVAAFVAAGFEHSVANMYLIPMAMLIQAGGAQAAAPILWSGFAANLIPVVLGNIVGGSVLVGVVFHIIYRPRAASE